ECEGLGVCARICPNGLVRVAGEEIDSAALAARLAKYAPVFEASGGGITISGGEPLFQPQFLLDLLSKLKPLHTVVETSAHADGALFKEVISAADLILFDLKLFDPIEHKKYTGVDNCLILQNLAALKASGREFVVRMPIIPGVNDTREHFALAARLLMDARDRVTIEVLPYNPLAGAKYAAVGMSFAPTYDESRPAAYYLGELESVGLNARML
ncbi:MAG: radical SAM protein, partial [Oscillospiraceae bacterium]|nr:radical SAM protein [Oscillospiraceae bacterium]